MAETIATTPLKAVFKFPFQAPDWRNRFLIGAGLTFASFIVPIVPLIFVGGYVLQIMRQAIEGRDLELPAWDDWGKLGVDGLRLMLVGLVYLLPGMLIMFGGIGLYFISSFFLPILLAVAEESGRSALALLLPLFFLGSMAIMMVSMLVGGLLYLLGLIFLPAAITHFAAHDKVAAAFRVREWWPLLRANKLGYLIAWVVVAGLMALSYAALIMVYYTLVLCCFIPLLMAPAGFYVSLVSGVLFGQTYRESVAMLAARSQPPAG
jgi:hypothetical protein